MTPLEIAGAFFIAVTVMRLIAGLLIRLGHWMQEGKSQVYTFYIRTSDLPEDLVKMLQSKGHFVVGWEETQFQGKKHDENAQI